jgi:4-hydroxybenzoyl-CoA thioesterase
MKPKRMTTELTGHKLSTWPLPYAIPFSDVDHAGIVFFPRVFTYTHLAYEAWYNEWVGQLFPESFLEGGAATPVVSAEASFQIPMRHGDHIILDVHCEHVGTRSFVLGYRIYDADDRQRCVIRITHATIAYSTFQPEDIPDTLRNALNRQS